MWLLDNTIDKVNDYLLLEVKTVTGVDRNTTVKGFNKVVVQRNICDSQMRAI